MGRQNHDDYKVVPFPKLRHVTAGLPHHTRQRHTIHALVEVDVTKSRKYIREHKARTGETLSFTVCIATCLAKGVVDGRIEIREYLSMTISMDHDIIDGAPAARFTQRLKELIESSYGLRTSQSRGTGSRPP